MIFLIFQYKIESIQDKALEDWQLVWHLCSEQLYLINKKYIEVFMGFRYFVDEAGDTALFKRHGTVIIGQEGCSVFFYTWLS